MPGAQSVTNKSLLVPLLTRPRVAQFVKWTVYLALTINFGVYAYDDWMAYQRALAPGAPWSDIFEQFATTIDMAAWLGVVFLFELETYTLPDLRMGFIPLDIRLLGRRAESRRMGAGAYTRACRCDELTGFD